MVDNHTLWISLLIGELELISLGLRRKITSVSENFLIFKNQLLECCTALVETEHLTIRYQVIIWQELPI